jgi:hypothetical protein
LSIPVQALIPTLHPVHSINLYWKDGRCAEHLAMMTDRIRFLSTLTLRLPLSPQVSHDDVMEQGAAAATKMRALLVAAVPRIAATAGAGSEAVAAAAVDAAAAAL